MAEPLDALAPDLVTEIFFKYGTPIFYAGLASGVALIVIGLRSIPESAWRKRGPVVGAAILLLMIAAFCQVKVDTDRGFIADQERKQDEFLKKITRERGKEEALKMQYMYMPAGNSLQYITLGNPSLAADYVWLTSLQYVSNSFRRGEKFEMLARFHRTMVDLDPHWIDAQCNGGKVLSALIEEREKAEESYKYSIAANIDNPDVWRLRYEAGLLYVMPPSDPNKMAEFSRRSAMYFDQATVSPGFPKELLKITQDRIARLRLESGSAFYREAEELLARNATAGDSPGSLQEISRRDWLRAHSMALATALTDEAEAFKKAKGAYPATLDEIIKRFAKPEAFAMDAYGFPFDYDPVKGEVTSHGAKAVRAVQSSHVVNDIVGIYRGSHDGKPPKNLAELKTFVQGYKEAPLHPPTVMVVEAIGKNLDPTIGPLGPWQYDAEKGVVILPPEADIKKLYGSVENFEWKPEGIVRKSKAP